MYNIYDDVNSMAAEEEVITCLLQHKNIRIERIISSGQITPEDKPYYQNQDEWIVVLQGKATIQLEDKQTVLNAGDTLFIPRHTYHRVTYTSAEPKVIWLAVHIDSC
ncbi:MAG: cupin domain-containing protein [Endozoicomonadaceae bacterium]|nr:cupin domain-containing protein [Endozoicomonadaceae bacterium]MCY4329129.1 cupin domain-containing protein [Endozoicomonadaceae bacterium]